MSTELVISLVALGVSLVNTVVLIIDRRPRMKAHVRFGNYKRSQAVLNFIAVNVGGRAIHLIRFGLILPDGSDAPYYPPGRGLPAPKLEEPIDPGGHLFGAEFPEMLASDLHREGFSGTVTLRWFVEDASGRRYRTKRLKFDVDKWLNPTFPQSQRAMRIEPMYLPEGVILPRRRWWNRF